MAIDRDQLVKNLERLFPYVGTAVLSIATGDVGAVEEWIEGMADESDDELRLMLRREARQACQLATRLRGLAGAYARKRPRGGRQ